MRVLQVAPFARAAAFGGSQRATSVAERLEERGAEVTWAVRPPRVSARAGRLVAAVLPGPAAVRYARRAGPLPEGSFDVALAAHSYMAPQLENVEGARVVDFHNLEWRHLDDVAALERSPRRLHLRAQAARMRRYEAKLVRSLPLTLFASSTELEWAEATGGWGKRLLVPNLLPRETRALAEQAWLERQDSRRDGLLLYVGKLTFPPNLLSLERFLSDTWPAVLSSNSTVRLRVVGDCSVAARARLARHPRVEVLGFVEDLRPSLVQAAAAVFPFDGSAGSSLRALLFALTGLPAIGSPAALREFGSELGIAVASRADWVEAVRVCLDGENRGDRARTSALALHNDQAPWDALFASMSSAAGLPEATHRVR